MNKVIKSGLILFVCIVLLCSCASSQDQVNDAKKFYEKCHGKVTTTIEYSSWGRSVKITCPDAAWYE